MVSAGRDSPAESGGGVQSVDRAVTVLEILARTGGAGVSAVALELDVHKSTASRLLSALEERELVEQDGERGKYRLGLGVLRLASAVVGQLDLVSQSRAVLHELAAGLGETVNVAILRGNFVVNVDQARGTSAVAAQNWTGRVTPLHATSSGKVLLAYESTASRRRLLDAARIEQYTARTIVNRRELQRHLDEIAHAGHALALEEFEAGLNAAAVPIRDHAGVVIASLSISGPAYRLDGPRLDEMLPVLKDGATRISERMGHLS